MILPRELMEVRISKIVYQEWICQMRSELTVADAVFPRYRDKDIEEDFRIRDVMFELVADIF